MRTILHIGRHKTGTSSLQRYLSDNAGALSGHGYLYPVAGRKGIAHHKLAETFTRKNIKTNLENSINSRNYILDEMSKEIAQHHHTLIISSEVFQNCNPRAIQQAFPQSEFQIILYVREQYDYMVSAYQQKIHAQKEYRTLEEFSKEFKVDYFNFISEWEKEFGLGNMSIRVFSRAALLNGDVVDDFMQQVGILPLKNELRRRVVDQNPSIGGGLLELKRLINKLHENEELPAKMYAAFSDLAQEGDAFRARPLLEAEEVASYRKNYFESNLKMANRFLNMNQSPFSIDEVNGGSTDVDVSFRAALGRLIQSNEVILTWLFKAFSKHVDIEGDLNGSFPEKITPNDIKDAIDQICRMAKLLQTSNTALKANRYVGV